MLLDFFTEWSPVKDFFNRPSAASKEHDKLLHKDHVILTHFFANFFALIKYRLLIKHTK